MSNFKTEITKIHYNRRGDINPLLLKLFDIFSIFYDFAVLFRNFLYDRLILKVECVNARVISVGNITTGGVGKTPVVAEIANYYANEYGERVCIISRGYAGTLNNKEVNVIKDISGIHYNVLEAGDEPYWLSQKTHPEVIILTCADRVKAAEYAINKYQVTKIILDDGFQHRKIFRDCDIVLVDSDKRFGNNKLLPAGPLRERLSSLKRADIIYVISKNTDHSKAEDYVKTLKYRYGKEVRLCKIEPEKIYNLKTGEELDKSEPVTALCAIGQPDQFIKLLGDLNVRNKIFYADHHVYLRDEISSIKGKIITTEKDAVKLKEFGFDNIYVLKLKTILAANKLLK